MIAGPDPEHSGPSAAGGVRPRSSWWLQQREDGWHAAEIDTDHRRLLRRLLILLIASAAVLVLLARADRSQTAARLAMSASPAWLALSVITIAATYCCAAVVMVGATNAPLPVRTTLLAQLAVAFANRLAPGGVGGVAVTVRYLQRVGATRPQALASVAANATGVALVHLAGFIVVLPFVRLPTVIDLPDGGGLLVGVVVTLVLAGVVLAVMRATHPSRESFRDTASSFRLVYRWPRHRLLLLGGATALTATHCLTLWAVLRSVGAATSLADCTFVYLAAAAIGALSPTPGGIGAMEAALVTGLTAASTGAADAAAAVLLYHLLSFWVPVVPGAAAFARMCRRSLI